MIYLILSFVVIIILWMDRWKITPYNITIINTVPIAIGYYLLDQYSYYNFFYIYILSLVIISIGYYFTKKLLLKRNKNNLEESLPQSNVRILATYLFCIIIILLCCYHFIVGGIPVLSKNVEVDRFSFSSSGLFGIPGRMFLFGMPLVVTYATLLYFRSSKKKFSKLFIACWFFYFIFQFISGFKGALLTLVVQILIIAAISGKEFRIKDLLIKPRYSLLFFIAVLYAVSTSFFYKSVGVTSIKDSFNYLYERLTLLSASPGYFALENMTYFNTDKSFFIQEIYYYLNKYLKIGSSSNFFPLEMQVSAALTGTPLSQDNFIVSVTLGGFPSLVVDFGIVISLVFMLLIGIIFAVIYHWSSRCKSVLCSAFLGLLLMRMNVIIINGSIIYNIINVVLIIVLLYLIYVFSFLVSHVVIYAIKNN
ncbi:O-antigen polymerase [Priestia flexa]|uniref:O-antigen polymerase n=1 Tax=Priestia flexa TaxID=86664 RepID=UPI0013D78D80|nr:O-antigen polymerase [Priestia flexa]